MGTGRPYLALSLAAGVLAWAAPVAAQDAPAPDAARAGRPDARHDAEPEARADTALDALLDARIGEYMLETDVPGLAVGVVKGGRTAYVRGFGIADPATGRAVTPQSLFHVASLSKTFTATAVLQLAQEESVDLDAPVFAYVPSFRVADDRFVTITVRQLLTHTSGLPDITDYDWEHPESDEQALDRYVRSLADRDLVAAPGARWHYSNMGYEVLGDLVARVSGTPFEAYVREHILSPAGMSQSSFLLSEVDASLRTTPHVGRSAPEVSAVYPYHRAHAPSSTLHSNAEEMCRWIIACAGRGAIENRRLLADAAYDEMWSAQATIRPGRGQGMGWMVAASPLGPWLLHGGRDVGFRSHLTILPEQGGGLVILSNWSETPIPPLRDAILDIAFAPVPAPAGPTPSDGEPAEPGVDGAPAEPPGETSRADEPRHS